MIRKFYQKYYYYTLTLFIISIIVIGCDKEISQSILEPEPSAGFIYVNSAPSGFTIFQNGKNTGKITPDSLPFLEEGNYSITLKRKYYKDTTVVVTLVKDEKKQIHIDFLTNPSMRGKIFLNSQPQGASIIIDDSITNYVTPYTITGLLPGEYNVRLKLFNHRDTELIAAVYSSQVRNYTKTLQDTSVWVDYQTVNSNIPTNVLTSIAVDHNNIKWIGSYNGLIKYDEILFTSYNTSNSQIPNNTINCISIDDQNIVWVGTQSGIGRFDGTSWTVYNKNNSGLRTDEILSVKIDPQNSLWAGTSSGLYKFDGNTWNRYNDSLLSIWANDIELDNENIWIATNEGVVKFTNGAFQYYKQPDYNYPSFIVSSTAKDMIGNIWFCHKNSSKSRNGISYFDGTQFVNFFPGSSLNSVNHISVDMFNNKWVSTNEGLVRLSSNNNILIYNRANSLISSNVISSSAIDKNGILWVTNSSNGLNKFKFNSN